MFKKIATVYRRSGLLGVLLAGISYEIKQTSKFFSNSAEWILTKIPISLNDKELLNKNQIFKNKHIGQRCFVIGNGPSLNKQDLSLLSNEITITVNAFYKNPIVEKWQPTYYGFADPLLFNGSEEVNKFFCDLRSRIHSSKFLVPVYAQKIIAEQNLLPLEQTYYAAFRGDLGNNLKQNIDLVKPILGVINVVQLGIMWAIYMGCSPIYLLGLDHDWLAKRGMDNHFYTGKTIENSLEAHGDLSKIPYHKILKAVLSLWSGYNKLSIYTSKRGIKIINLTNGGFLDVFERMSYESIKRDEKGI